MSKSVAMFNGRTSGREADKHQDTQYLRTLGVKNELITKTPSLAVLSDQH